MVLAFVSKSGSQIPDVTVCDGIVIPSNSIVFGGVVNYFSDYSNGRHSDLRLAKPAGRRYTVRDLLQSLG